MVQARLPLSRLPETTTQRMVDELNALTG